MLSIIQGVDGLDARNRIGSGGTHPSVASRRITRAAKGIRTQQFPGEVLLSTTALENGTLTIPKERCLSSDNRLSFLGPTERLFWLTIGGTPSMKRLPKNLVVAVGVAVLLIGVLFVAAYAMPAPAPLEVVDVPQQGAVTTTVAAKTMDIDRHREVSRRAFPGRLAEGRPFGHHCRSIQALAHRHRMKSPSTAPSAIAPKGIAISSAPMAARPASSIRLCRTAAAWSTASPATTAARSTRPA